MGYRNRVLRYRAHRSWFYPLRLLRRRPAAMLSGAAVLFCLFSLVTLSLLMAEGVYLQNIADGQYGRYYGVLYRLNHRQHRILMEMAPSLEAEFTVIPVYAELEDIDSTEKLAGVTLLTEQTADWYALSAGEGRLPGAGEILLPDWLAKKEPYYRMGQACSFFFHGEDGTGGRTGISITRELTYAGTAAANDRNLPYAFVTPETAEDILSAAEGQILYDVYFTTPLPSDYAAALVIDALLPALDWPELCTDPRDEWDGIQQRYDALSRRIRYQDFINYNLLDLLNREYMDDPMFFFLILPVILAAALGAAGLLRNETEIHLREYGLLKAAGAGNGLLYRTLYGEAALMLGLVILPVLGSTIGIAGSYLQQTEAMLAAQGIAHRFSLPAGNLAAVFLYVLALTCLFLYLHARRLFTGIPADLLRHTTADDTPEVRLSAWQVLEAPDPVRYMVKVLMKRERKRRLHNAFTQSFLMGVCGYMLVSMLRGGEGMEALYAVYLYGAYLLLAVLGAFSEIRQQRREYALLRQCGAADGTVWHKVRWTQFYAAMQGMGVTMALFGVLFLLPVFMSGWIFEGTPVARFLLSEVYLKGVIFSGLAALVLQLGNLGIGQLVMIVPVRRMLKCSILDDLRHGE